MSLMPIIYSDTSVFQQRTYKMFAFISLFKKDENQFSENRLKKTYEILNLFDRLWEGSNKFEFFYKENVLILTNLHVLQLM